MGKFDDQIEPEIPSQRELALAAEALHWYVLAQELKVGIEYRDYLLRPVAEDATKA